MSTKIIFSPSVARSFLKKGFKIVDIKPSKDNPDKTVFVFERTDELIDALSQLARK